MTYRGAATFDGKVDGAVIPLTVGPDGAIRDAAGQEVPPEAIEHPRFAPELGLVAAKDGPQDYPSHAGLVLKAKDTGRVLMVQRSLKDDADPNAGLWEFPGGKLEPGDHNTLGGAIREWQEEVGQEVPAGGVVAHTWTTSDGVYQGHVVVVPSEDDVVLYEGRTITNPDDPDSDSPEQAAWWRPEDAAKNPALRPEVRKVPWRQIREAAGGRTTTAMPDQQGAPLDELGWHSPVGQQIADLFGLDLDEFGDLPQGVDGTVDDDPEHALPVAYGDELASLSAGAGMARTAVRDFSRAEQARVIEEGGDCGARNVDRLMLEGTHYLFEDDEYGWG